MRTISTDLEQVLGQSDYATWIKAEVSPDDGSTWFELNDTCDRDWILDLSYETDESQDFDRATLRLKLLIDDMSISPYITTSKPNTTGVGALLKAYNPVRIYTAMLPRGILPVDADYYWVFDGRIEETGMSGAGTVSVRCVSRGAELAQTFIRNAGVKYGSAGGTNVETVIQSLLTTWDPSTSTLRTPTSPSFAIVEYKTRREPLFQAIKNLAQQCGSYVRYQWWSATADFQHVFVFPDRTATTSNRTFGFDRILSGFSTRLSAKEVRNRITVRYRNRNSGGAWSVATTSNAASITKYGDRYMEVVETETSQIDTPTEASNLAGYALDDLREPGAIINLPVPYYYAPELGDLITVEADDIHFSADQKLAVTGAMHSISQGDRGTTTLKLQGRPRMAQVAWRGIQNPGQSRKEWTTENKDKDSDEGASINGNASFLHWSE